MRARSTGGVELAVHELGGDPGAPLLLLAHATGLHGLVLAPLGEHLVDRYRVVSFDFRGHGTSGRPADGDFAWTGFADDVLAVLDAAGAGSDVRPVALGHSMGGAALLLAEAARPGTFAALACFEPIVFPPDEAGGRGNPLAEGALRRRDVFASKEEALANFARKPPLDELAPAALRAYVDHGFEDLPDGGARLRCRPEDEAAIYRGGGTHAGWRLLPAVHCPVTVMAGEHSLAVAPSLAAEQAARLPAGHLSVAPGLGHFGPLQDPAAVAGAVATALADGSP